MYAVSEQTENKKKYQLLLIAYAFVYKHRVRSHGLIYSTRRVHGRLRVNMQHRFTTRLQDPSILRS